MEIIFDNAFLYFFSTIPQVLGALIALLGVFLLFKFESIKNTIISFGRQSQDYFEEDFILKNTDHHILSMKRKLHHGIIRSDQETVASQVSGINIRLKEIIGKTILNENEKSIMWSIEHNNEIQFKCLEQRNQLRKKSKILLVHSGIVIIISLMFLFLVPILTQSKDCLIIQFLIGTVVLLWFGVCLYKMIRLINISLTRDY